MRCARILLLVLLIPLLLFASWVVQQDVWYPIQAFAFSSDGTKLWTLHLTRHVWSPGTIKLWDLRTGKQLRQRTGIQSECLILSPDDRLLITGGLYDTGLQVWDAETLEEIRTPLTGRFKGEFNIAPEAFCGGQLLISSSSPIRLEVLNAETGHALKVIAPKRDFSTIVVARDKPVFAMRHFTNARATPPTPTSVYRIGDDGCELLQKQWDATPRALSPDGKTMLVVPDGPGISMLEIIECRSTRDGDILWRTSAKNNACCAFLSDADRVVLSNTDGQVEIRDADTGKLLHGWSSPNWLFLPAGNRVPQNDVWLGNRFYAQNPEDVMGRGPIQVIDLVSGQPIVTLPMTEGRFIALLVAASLLVLAWSIAWMVQSRKAPRWHPLLEAGVVHGVVLFLLLLRILTTESQQDLYRPAAWLLFGQLAGLACLAVMWTILARQRWLIRIAACTFVLALLAAGMMGAWSGDDSLIWQVVIGATSLVTCLAAALLLLRRWGWQLRPPDYRELPGSASAQYPLRDLMILATAFGVFFAAARFFVPSMLAMWNWFYLIAEGFAFALMAPFALWATMGAKYRWLAGMAFLIVAPAAFVISYLPFVGYGLLAWWWYFAVHTLAAFHLGWTLLLFRWHGYRMEKGYRSSAASFPATSDAGSVRRQPSASTE